MLPPGSKWVKVFSISFFKSNLQLYLPISPFPYSPGVGTKFSITQKKFEKEGRNQAIFFNLFSWPWRCLVKNIRFNLVLFFTLLLIVFQVSCGGSGGGGGGNTGDTGIVPAPPTGLTATATSSSQINLSWTASAGTVTGYKVYKNGSYLKSVTTTSTSDTGLSSSTNYCYTVSAYNSTGESGQSSQACATTQAPPSASSMVWAWGYNVSGQLGDGTNTNRLTPVQVNGLINVMAIAGGGEHSLAR